MSRFLKISMLLIASLCLVIGILGCTLENEDPPEETDDGFTLTPYQAVGFSNLGTLEIPEQADVDEVAGSVVESMLASLELGLMGMQNAFAELALDTTDSVDFVPKTINGSFSLQIDDEHFAIDKTEGETISTLFDLNIDYLDLILEGEIDSLTSLIQSMINETPPTDIFPANAHIGISGKTVLSANADDIYEGIFKSTDSLYVDIQVTDFENDFEEDEISGLLSAKFNYSNAMNMAIVPTDIDYDMYEVPVALTIAIKPIVQVQLSGLDSIFSFTEEPTAQQLWAAIKTAFWGTTTDTCISISASYKNASGTSVTDLLTDEEVIQFFIDMVSDT